MDQETVAEPRSWWGRNWKWFVPGCLVLVVLACGGGLWALFGVGVKAIKQTEPYTLSMQLLRDDARAVAILGEPIEDGLMPQLNAQSNSGGPSTMNMVISVEGPKAAGKLHSEAVANNGVWRVTFLRLEAGGQQVDIVAAAPPDLEGPERDVIDPDDEKR